MCLEYILNNKCQSLEVQKCRKWSSVLLEDYIFDLVVNKEHYHIMHFIAILLG